MNEVYIVAIITIFVIGILFVVIPKVYSKFSKTNINLDAAFNSTESIMNAINVILNNIKIPINTKQTIDMIMEYSIQAVQFAEQLYKSGQLDKDFRKAEAVAYIEKILKVANIEVTDDIKNIITSTIESAVLLLPKTHE